MSPLDNSHLPAEIGDYDQQRPVQAFLMWRSNGSDVDGMGRISGKMTQRSRGCPVGAGANPSA